MTDSHRSREELEQGVWEALRRVTFPGMSRDVVSFGFVKQVLVDEDRGVSVRLEIPTHNPGAADQIRRRVEETFTTVEGIGAVQIDVQIVEQRRAGRPPAATGQLLPSVDKILAVASGKGGVGKSTVASNLAVRLSQLGHRVGLLDADIYGPSIPTMFGIRHRPTVVEQRIQPFERHGVRLMSLGFILDADTPVIWRGPMVMKALEQLLRDVEWGELDYLIVDLPPGTGDAQLTLTQKVPLSGAVIVSTPQEVALADARKGIAMFRKVNVPVVGIIENMSFFVCRCGETTEIFKRGGARRIAEELGCPFLGEIPLVAGVVEGGDSGTPIVVSEPDGPAAQAFQAVAEATLGELGRRSEGSTRLSIV